MSDSIVKAEFLKRYLADHNAGNVKPLSYYQSLFPGDEDLVAREYAGLQGEGAAEVPVPSVEPESSWQRFGKYRLLEELGRGGQGAVYLAEDTGLHRRVALKVISRFGPDMAGALQRLQREAMVASRLNHPGICTVYESGMEGGAAYIAMELVQGETLARQIASQAKTARPDNGETPPSSSSQAEILRTVGIVEKAARALHSAHEVGVVHRDVKPSNIIMTPEGQPVILDFGLAREVEGDLATLTRTGDFFGTPAYMAPEQLQADRIRPDRRIDVWTLGVSLYECLTLRRPFEAPSREQLYRQILTAAPPDPRTLNRRISKDLKVVLETALEKDRDRRYQTAEALAEDLRRIREREPIQARPIGPVTRAWKWSKRHPGQAVAVVAAMVVLVAVAGILIGLSLGRERAIREHLRDAESQLADGDFNAALAAVGQALGLDQDSPSALRLRARVEEMQRATRAEERQKAAFAAAVGARAEAAQKSREYDEGMRALAPRRKEVATFLKSCMNAYAPTWKRATLARQEMEFANEEARLERLLAEGREALERAFRLESPHLEGKPSSETLAAFADFLMGRFREHIGTGDLEAAGRQGEAVRQYDESGRHAKELLGRGTLTVTVEPADAEVFLFRYESYETVRSNPPVVPRLVPVPTMGIGRRRPDAWLKKEDFFPGDICLVVTEVVKDSLAANAGLETGDLVVRLNGQSCGDGLFVTEGIADSALAEVDVKPLTRITFINGETVESAWDWEHAAAPKDGIDRIRFSDATEEIQQDRKSVPCAAAVDLVPGDAPGAMRLLCLHAGEALTLSIPEGRPSGLTVEVTAYPLILSPETRIAAGKTLSTDPGSYLLLVRRQGYEDQRFPVVVPREDSASAKVILFKSGTTPPGFVYVPPGPFIYGGDPKAHQARPREVKVLAGFFIAKKEVTNQEYFAFLNDPQVRRLIDIKKGGAARFVPRQSSRVLVREDGQVFLPDYGTMKTPVLGISWNDIKLFLKWRNRRAQAAGEKWLYDLPTEEEWGKAARGVDNRIFPWGDRFDHSLTVGGFRKQYRLCYVPGGFEPRDASPYGLLALGGSRYEWMKSEFSSGSGMYVLRGGAWSHGDVRYFRIDTRDCNGPTLVSASYGFRLVLRPRP